MLLCRKCRRSVSSGQTCPYCFQVTGNSGDLCTCRVCHRKIHKDCVRDYGKFTPWCYLGAGFEGFRVCVDCWVPELLKNSVQVLGRSDNTGLKDKGEGEYLLENMEQNGKREVDKKVKKAGKGKEQVSRGAKGPIGEGNLMDGSSGSLSKNDRDSMKAGNSNCSGETEVPDDAELAIQLHRVINSSPRILRGKPLGNATDIRIWKGLSYKRSGIGKRCSKYQELEISASSAVNGRMDETVENDSSSKYSGLIPYRRDRKRNIWQLGNENTEISEYTSSQQAALKNLHSDEGVGCSFKNGSDTSENSIRANTGRNSSCKDGGRFRQELIGYKRHRFRKKESELNGQTNVSGDSSSCDNHGVAFKSECHLSDFAILNTISVVKTHPEKILPSGSDTERDRFHLKYAKRIPGAKNDSSFLHFGTFLSEIEVFAPAVSHAEAAFPVNDCEATLPNKGCAHSRDRYSFKYAKRVKSSNNSSSNAEAKMHSDAFVVNVGGSAMGLTTNCSAESRTLSDISFDSLTVDLPQ